MLPRETLGLVSHWDGKVYPLLSAERQYPNVQRYNSKFAE